MRNIAKCCQTELIYWSMFPNCYFPTLNLCSKRWLPGYGMESDTFRNEGGIKTKDTSFLKACC